MNSIKIAMVIAVAALGYAGFGGTTDADRVVSDQQVSCVEGECVTALGITPSSSVFM